MRYSMPTLSRLALMLSCMAPFYVIAAPEVTSCPLLLTERECDIYLAERRQASSERDQLEFKEKYAALLQERYSLCPCQVGPPHVDELGETRH
jgi:hypothetical protein